MASQSDEHWSRVTMNDGNSIPWFGIKLMVEEKPKKLSVLLYKKDAAILTCTERKQTLAMRSADISLKPDCLDPKYS